MATAIPSISPGEAIPLPVRMTREENKKEDAPAAPPSRPARSYLDLPKAGCLLEADSAGPIEELGKLLEAEGLSKIVKFEIVEGNKILFHLSAHDLWALALANPKLRPYFGNTHSSCFFHETYKDRQFSEKGLSEISSDKAKVVYSLIEQANRHFQSNSAPAPVEFSFETWKFEESHLRDAYEKFQGVCIGENHFHVQPKRFLFENLELLRDLGVKTLFMEHFDYDAHQPLLDAYFDNPDAELSPLLLALEKGRSSRYQCSITYPEILRKAKACGIRIVGIDTNVARNVTCTRAYQEDPLERVRAMNFVAKAIIEREKGDGKYLAYMGAGHAGTQTLYRKDKPLEVLSTSPGLADLLQCPFISISDSEGLVTYRNVTDSLAETPGIKRIVKHIHLLALRPKSYQKLLLPPSIAFGFV